MVLSRTTQWPKGQAVAFDIDAGSLSSLRKAFPDWEICPINQADTHSIDRDWDPGSTDLLVVGARGAMTETLGLCRALRSQHRRAHTPLIVLLGSTQKALLRAVLQVGASGCLELPVDAKEFVAAFKRVRAGRQFGRHTRDIHPPADHDAWRDEGGEG